MEWVETTAKTVENAKELALDQLGIDHDEAEFVIVEEPRPGLFGRVRGEARVRARVAPRTPRAKVERRNRKPRSEGKASGAAKSSTAKKASTPKASVAAKADSDDAAAPEQAEQATAPKKRRSPRTKKDSPTNSPAGAPGTSPTKEGSTMTLTLEEQITTAESFLAGLLDAFGLTGTIETNRVDDTTAELNVVGDDLGVLIGPRGQTISSIQELTRIALQRQANGSYEGRVRIDVSGYREQRRQALGRFAVGVAEKVRDSGKPTALEPMSAADRKAVHDAINEIDGVHTTSEGAEPRRWVMIVPDETTDVSDED